MLDDALTARIAAAKRRLTTGGLLRPVEWLRPDGVRDVRGRQGVTTTMLDALIQDDLALDRDRTDTDRNDDTLLTILEPVAITDEHLFRWGITNTT